MAERDAAVLLAAKVGVNEAARRLKVPQPTLSHWRAGRGEVLAPASAVAKTKAGTSQAKRGAGRGGRDAATPTTPPQPPPAPAATPGRRKVVAKSYTPSQKAEVELTRIRGRFSYAPDAPKADRYSRGLN